MSRVGSGVCGGGSSAGAETGRPGENQGRRNQGRGNLVVSGGEELRQAPKAEAAAAASELPPPPSLKKAVKGEVADADRGAPPQAADASGPAPQEYDVR